MEPSQQNIWSHFQNPQTENIFGNARARHAAILRRIRRLSGSTRPEILNIGIGDGNLERAALQLGWAVSSLDPDAAAVGNLCREGVDAKAGFIESIPFATRQFDFVVASEVLEHLDDRQRQAGLAEISRVLKPTGHFIGTVPYNENLNLHMTVCPQCRHVFHRWGHAVSFDLPSMRQELAPFFGEVRCNRMTFVNFRGRSLAGKLKSLVRLAMGKCGAAIAWPNIFFVASLPKS